jgi:adenosylcobinamide-GDP ribazoletransferase
MTDHTEGSHSPFHPRLLLVATQFLSSLPPLSRRPVDARQLGQAIAFFPLVGLWMGGLLLAADWLLGGLVAAPLKAALLLGLWLLLSGGLHVDGLLDSFDGLFGGRTQEQRLEIMHDEAVGAFGFAAGAVLLLLKYSALQAAGGLAAALLLAPVLGRWAMAMAIVAFPYARREGLGSAMKTHAGPTQVVLASLVALAAAWLVAGLLGLLALAALGLLLLGAGRVVLARVPGFTGDVYGALCEISEVLVLILLAGRL